MALADVLRSQRVLPVIRGNEAEPILQNLESLAAAGCAVIELTATIPAWDEVYRAARRRFPGLAIGMGSIRTAAEYERAAELGVDFMVSPFPIRSELKITEEQPALIEGGATPGEVYAASRHGIAKLFPAHLGGPAYLKSILAVMPDARVIPTGGIKFEDIDAYLTAGAWAVGIGSGLPEDPDELAAVFAGAAAEAAS